MTHSSAVPSCTVATIIFHLSPSNHPVNHRTLIRPSRQAPQNLAPSTALKNPGSEWDVCGIIWWPSNTSWWLTQNRWIVWEPFFSLMVYRLDKDEQFVDFPLPCLHCTKACQVSPTFWHLSTLLHPHNVQLSCLVDMLHNCACVQSHGHNTTCSLTWWLSISS